MATLTLHEAAGRSLLFVCPAHRRVDLAAVCYRQLAGMRDTLRVRGVNAQVLVIADDGNLDAAHQAGLATLEHDNRLGAKLNAGYTWAHQQGYEYACAVGNDSWLHPDRFRWMPDHDTLLCTRNYLVVAADGGQQARLRIRVDGGTGSRVIPLRWLAACDYKPVDPYQTSGCDTSTLMTICRNVERAPHLVYTDLNPYEVVGFQTDGDQITPLKKWLWCSDLDGWEDAFTGLADHYPAELVADVAHLYERQLLTATGS